MPAEFDERAEPIVLTVPGLNGSGPGHWQTYWEASRGDCERAELGMWSHPRRNVWVTKLNSAIAAQRRPVILCAHSLGCLAVAWWAALEGQSYGRPVAGALLVAPPDCGSRSQFGALTEFGPTPQILLPFPSILVASRTDPFAEHMWSFNTAKFWGSHFVDVGELGHVNAESGLGPWLFGQRLLDRLISVAVDAGRSGRRDPLASGPWALYPPATGPAAAMGDPGE